MKLIENLDEKRFVDFLLKSKYNHFLQTPEWGKIITKTRGQKYELIGLEDNKKIVAAAMLLRKDTPFNMCYYYVTRGYLIDYNNKELLTTFTNELKAYLKKKNAIYLKIDPEIMYQTIDSDAKKIDGPNNYELFNHLISLGYRHQGFNKLHEKNQPRYTYRRYFKNYQSIEAIDASISKTFMKTVKRSYNYELEVSLADNIDDFIELNKYNAKKDGFSGYKEDFYHAFYDITKDTDYVKIFNISIEPGKLIKKFEQEIKDINKQIKENTLNKKDKGNISSTLERLEKDITELKKYDPNKQVITSMVCVYTNTGAWTLYIGNNHLGEYTFAVNRVYYEAIIDAFNNKFEFIDLFGTVGDPNTKYKNLGGLHEYKRKFGDEYIEFIGEFDLINKKLMYYILPILLKVFRFFKKLLKRR